MLDTQTRRLRPLAIGVYIKHDRMLIKWEYSTSLHRRETIEAFVARAEEVLRSLLAGAGIEGGRSRDEEPAASRL